MKYVDLNVDMQKIQDTVFSIVKTTNLAPAVFNFLQPSDDFVDKTPLGGILQDTKHGWLALGPKFCVVDLRTGLKVAARTFGSTLSNQTTVTSVVELPKPLTENSQQLVISLQCDDIGMICILHINGSQILRCMQTDVVVTELAICDRIPDGPFTCFDGLIMAGTKRGEIFVFDLNRASLIQALKDISQGYEHLVQNEANPSSLSFLPLNAIERIEEQRELAIENDHHLAVLLNENSMVDGQYIFRNPDGTVRMKAKRDHIRVTVLQYVPQLGSMVVGFNFGAFQMWNLMTLELEFTSQVNVECLPVTHFAFQEPCDDPRAFCYLWVIFSVIDRYEEEEFPLAVMYSLTYQGKRMLSDTKCLYQDFSTATIRFQVELSTLEEAPLLGGKCISCHSYSIKSTLGDEGEDSMLNICQLVWECWGEDTNSPMEYGMLLFDLDQWYKDQMPATYRLESNAFMAASWCRELTARGAVTLHARLEPASVCAYSHPTRLEEHFYPNSLQYNCICLNTSEALTLRTVGIQRQVVSALEAAGGAALLQPARLASAAAAAGLAPYAGSVPSAAMHDEDRRRYLLSLALEARLSRFLKRCAHDWATGSHSGVGCTLPFLVDWAWKRAIELKESAKELTAPLFVSAALPDRNVIRCLEHCVQQLTQLTGLMDAILTKCCNLVVPDALSEMEERHIGIGCVSLYFQVVQWFLRVGLLPERADAHRALPYPHTQLTHTYNKRRMKLNRLQENSNPEESGDNKSCALLYIDQLIEHEFGGDRIHQIWIKGGSETHGLYPPPSLYSLLKLYLLPDIAEEHKHSLVLYLLVDYSMIYDDVRYEAVIRRLMQFPTMFGLSNTAIKATQAFWHLDHRDFDFALDQLQCLTGNTLHEWQHNVVLSSLLAQKKTQAALQYLHVRKPAPVQNIKDGDVGTNYSQRLSDHDKLEDWQSCCNLYLARGLVFEALDVVRMCVQNTSGINDKAQVLNFFFKGCRNSGNLSKILQVTLLPFEEEVFVKYLENCNDSQTSDLLIMYYLQQARYLEAERYNNRLKQGKPQRNKDVSMSVESLFEVVEREGARDALVEVVCSALPDIAATVARAANDWDADPHVNAPKPMSVFVQAKSPKNKFTYKSSFIQDTIENASETWMNKPKMRRGLKRALDIEETPFICTPKLLRTRSVFTDDVQPDATPPKRARLAPNTRTPQNMSFRTDKLHQQMEELLDMPDAQSPARVYRDRPETPHSILKIRRNEREEAPSPVDSRYLGDSDDELLETASNHTHYSDSTNKHLRFTIPTASESGSTPSPPQLERAVEKDVTIPAKTRVKETDITDSFSTTISYHMNDNNPLPSASKKLATEANVQPRKSYKDTVRARRSLSISANSSLSEDPNTSIESIADIPVTLINPRYSGERKKTTISNKDDRQNTEETNEEIESSNRDVERNLGRLSTSARDLEINLAQSSMSTRDIEKNLGRSSTSARDVERNLGLSNTSTRDIDINLGQTNLSPRDIRNLNQSNFSIQDITYKHRFSYTSIQDSTITEFEEEKREILEVPRTPKGRRGIRSIGESTPLVNRSRSGTPERQDSPITTPLRSGRLSKSRSRSKTPELSPRSSPLAPIIEQPKQEESEPLEKTNTLTVPRRLRSRSKTPERMDRAVSESPKLEVIKESPTKSSDSPTSSPTRRSLRSRSHTPEVEIIPEPINKLSPPSLRSRSKTPEKLMSPKKEHSVRTKKSLSRMVLEANTFAKTKQTLETLETEITESRSESNIESTPMKSLKQPPSLMDVTLSPIVNKSVLQSFTDSTISENAAKDAKSDATDTELGLKPLPAFTTLHETHFGKSVLKSYQSSIADSLVSCQEEKDDQVNKTADTSDLKPLPAFTTINETDFNRSVLNSYESSIAESSVSVQEEEKGKQVELPKPFAAFASMIETDFERSVLHSHQSSIVESRDVSKETQNPSASSLITNDSDVDVKEGGESQDTAERKEKEKIVEIEREINEIEGDMSNESDHGDSTVESVEDSGTNEEESDESDSSEESSGSESDEENEVISIEDSEANDTESSDSNTDSNTINVADVVLPNKDNIQGDEKSDNMEVSEAVEGSSIDPLNQAQISLMTDDNSAIESDHSMNLNYSDEKIEQCVEEKVEEPSKEKVIPEEIQVQVIVEEATLQEEAKSKELEPVTVSMDVVDISAPEKASQETQPEVTETDIKTDEKSNVNAQEVEKIVFENPDVKKLSEIIEKIEQTIPEEKQAKDNETETESSTQSKATQETSESEIPLLRTRKRASSNKSTKEIETDAEKVRETDFQPKEDVLPEVVEESKEDLEKPVRTRKRVKSTSSNKSYKESEREAHKEILKETDSKLDESTLIKQVEDRVDNDEPRTPVTRKRSNSNVSTKSKSDVIKETPVEESAEIVEETKTPANRKRSQTTAFKPEESTPEDTPTRRRAKTPTSAEVRKIITRRVSREMAGKLDKSNESLDDSISLTPKRRAARSRSKIVDDNESVVSESSVVSNKSKVSEEAEMKPARKGRKSVVATKPDLSVIPEVITEESKEESSAMIADYSDARRLTRTQKKTFESYSTSPARGRRASTASRASKASHSSLASDQDETPPAFEVQPIDRISLLNKTDFEGPPDTDEFQNDMSPESVASDASNMRRSRLGRAASETKTVPRPAKINRRIASIDVVEASDIGSPGPSSAGSPARGRRASFNRACEALSTPKGRRQSTDVRSPMDSPATSEVDAPATPSRRPRRASTQSNTSITKSDTGKRSKKMPVLEEEDKEIKK